MYRLIAKIYPNSIRNKYKELLAYSDIKIETNLFIGLILFFGGGTSLLLAFFLGKLFNVSALWMFIAFFVFIQTLIYLWIFFGIDKKAKFVEDVLPDALQLMASNLRAGLTTDKALILAARPEFGPLKDEINLVGKEITMGKDIGKALMDMTKRIRSEKLRKTMMLIEAGISSGGELASLLEQTAENLRQQKFVDEKIKASVMMYVIFIFAAICFGSPLLFGLSSFLVEILKSSLGSIDLTGVSTSSLPISFKQVSISQGFLMGYIILSLSTTCLFGSMIIGMINKGKSTYGLRYLPVLLLLSFSFFFIVRFMIKGLIGGMFNL